MSLLLERKSKKTKNLALNLLLISILFTLTHLANDMTSSKSDMTSLIDSIIIITLILSSFLLFSCNFYYSSKSIDLIKKNNHQLAELEKNNQLLKDALTNKILAQFKVWNLSSSESDVAILLIKGFSTQEIATLRNSSDRTVRKQATEIYRKTNQKGRAVLAAFFLEDLL